MSHRLRSLALLSLLVAAAAPTRAAASPPRLVEVTWHASGAATELRLAVSGPVQHHVSMHGGRIVVDLWPAQLRGSPGPRWAGEGPLGRVWLGQPLPAVARVTAEVRRPTRYRVYQHGGTIALVLVPPWMGAVPLPASVGYRTLRVRTGRGPTTVHVLTVDARDPGLEVGTVLAGGRVRGTEQTSVMAHRYHAVAAVNGGFFAGRFPLGLVVVDGRLAAAPLGRRSALALTDEGATIRDFTFSGTVRPLGAAARRIGALNATPGPEAVGVFTDDYGPWAPYETGRVHVVVSGGTVTGHATDGAMIPAGGYVLSVPATEAEWIRAGLRVGQPVEVRWALSPSLPLRGAVGGGPRLVKAGRAFVPYDWEGFRPGVYAVRASRTAVGVTPLGKLVFVTVEGRSRRDPGMTLRELADLLVRLGARDAMNLDGGGSATMVVGGRVVNAAPGRERGVASAIVVVRRDRRQAQHP